ncbi:MAG: VWA domain-containing protein [Methanomicrobiales archaeon]|nr:VWA domain-containing protein [Methanomicrobiales archaeon]
MATVGSPTRISVLIVDRYGNPVTSRRAAKNVSYFASASGTGAFQDGTGDRSKAISVLLNETGWAEVTYLMSTKQGNNFIYITPPAPLASSLIDIMGIGDAKPFSISQSVNPAGNPPFILADGSSKAIIDYYLFDQWGNPATDQGIQIVTSAGENKIFYTNQEGRATILYGPKLTAGFYGITATSLTNSSVTISQTLQFGSLDPKDMLLTASPQTMASLDVNSNMVGHVIAKVIDGRGNAVKGQTVTFWIGKSDSSPYVRTKDPVIGSGVVTTMNIGAPIPVITDEYGQAILDYYPGAFPAPGKADYSATAQGTTTVNASWAGPDSTVNRSIDLSYKNYPFLSVYTEVNPKTVQKGTLVDVSVRLKGDGWALQPKPIDVVLCTDRSATMLNNESINPFPTGNLAEESQNDRMVDAMNAANTFVGKTSSQDRIGLVTFGDPAGGIAILYNTSVNAGNNPNWWRYISPYGFRAGRDYNRKVGQTCQDPSNRDYSDDKAYVDAHYPGHGTTGKDYRVNGVLTGAYIESNLAFDKGQITTAINSIVPAGGTPMRRAIYESVKLIINDPDTTKLNRNGAVRAIVLLTDGKWNTGGDPRGIVSSIFGIESYPELGTMGTGSVITWAKDNNIKIFTIALVGKDTSDRPNVAELQAYADETEGEAYVADANQENTGQALEGIYTKIAGKLREEASVDTQVALEFNNVEVNGTYTLPGNTVFKYEYHPEDDRSTFIVPPSPALPVIVDNTMDWDNGQQLKFSAGTIKVDEEWMVNFTLRVLTEGNIKVFNKSSKVTFTGIVGEVGIPDTYITAVPFGTEKGPEDITFTIDPHRTNPEDTLIAHLEWEPKYTGSDPQIDWTIYLAYPNSDAFGQVDSFTKDRGWSPFYNLDIRNLKPGMYRVKVRGHVNDATDAEGIVSITIPEPTATPKILIQ